MYTQWYMYIQTFCEVWLRLPQIRLYSWYAFGFWKVSFGGVHSLELWELRFFVGLREKIRWKRVNLVAAADDKWSLSSAVCFMLKLVYISQNQWMIQLVCTMKHQVTSQQFTQRWHWWTQYAQLMIYTICLVSDVAVCMIIHSAEVSSKPVHSFWAKTSSTSLALPLSMKISALNFILYTSLQPMGFLSSDPKYFKNLCMKKVVHC